ncbi:MAG: hypothetical protein R6W70_07750 [bacterium]
MKKLLLLTMILFMTAGSVFAQEVDDDGNIVKYKQKTVLDFEDVMLEGQIKKPTGSFLMDRTQRKFNSLIEMKKDFEEELIRSVDHLR